jgi:tetratricopeptide (TPR) repeat protein
MLAYVASRTDDRLQARLCADALLTHWPEEPLALAVAGVALAYTDRPRARQLLEAAIERRPNLFYARVNLALALSADGEMEGALEHARAAERSIPDNSQIHGILGMLLTKQAMLLGLPESDPKRRDLLERAVVHGRKRLADKPRDQVALLQVGSALERLGRVDEAWELALEIVRVAPTYTKGHKGVIGLARVRADIPAQRAEYLRWVDVNPNGPTAHRELAEFLLEHGAGKADLDLALRTIKRADQLMQGRDPFILVTLAEVLQRRGETMSIPRVLQRAEQFLPQDEESRGGLVGRIAALRAR